MESVYPALYRQIQELPWVEDGLSDFEATAIDELLYLGVDKIGNLQMALRLPWVQDAISDTEYDVLNWLSALGMALRLPWVQDAISDTEYAVLNWLSALGYEDSEATTAVIAMPFLESPDTTDVLAIRAMHRLAAEGALSALVDSAPFQEGIADAQTTLVTAVGTLFRDTDAVRRALTPGNAAIESVSAGTELTPDLNISIIRTGSQPQPWTARAVVDAVDFVERTMQMPLPTDHVVVVLNDEAVTSGKVGTNYGFAIGFLPRYEQGQGTFKGRRLQAGLVHEIAHYYWNGNEDWIDEGLANILEFMRGIEAGLSPGQLQTQRGDCEAHDLEMLSEWDPTGDDAQFSCNYYLGELLFRELLEHLGDEEFSEKIRELYRLFLTEQTIPGIDGVRQVFSDETDIINKHWSGALNAPENRPFDEGVDRTSHDLVQWDQHPTYDGRWVSFSGMLLDDAVLSQETIRQARGGGYSNFTFRSADGYAHQGAILPRLGDGRKWRLEDPGDAVAAVYELDERAFTVTFPFPPALDSPPDYVVIVLGFKDESRTTSISEGVDILGYARIRNG